MLALTSRTSRTVHARTVEPATERASALLEVSFFRASMAQAHGPRACDVEKFLDPTSKTRCIDLGTILKAQWRTSLLITPILDPMQRVFEVGSRNSVEDGGEDIKRRHPTARIVIEAFLRADDKSLHPNAKSFEPFEQGWSASSSFPQSESGQSYELLDCWFAKRRGRRKRRAS
jgi:hypothetical protein